MSADPMLGAALAACVREHDDGAPLELLRVPRPDSSTPPATRTASPGAALRASRAARGRRCRRPDDAGPRSSRRDADRQPDAHRHRSRRVRNDAAPRRSSDHLQGPVPRSGVTSGRSARTATSTCDRARGLPRGGDVPPERRGRRHRPQLDADPARAARTAAPHPADGMVADLHWHSNRAVVRDSFDVDMGSVLTRTRRSSSAASRSRRSRPSTRSAPRTAHGAAGGDRRSG
jgi:hypothetical protein